MTHAHTEAEAAATAAKATADSLRADAMIREFLEKKLRTSYLSNIEFERNPKTLKIIIATARPGMVIGRSGEGIETLKKSIIKLKK